MADGAVILSSSCISVLENFLILTKPSSSISSSSSPSSSSCSSAGRQTVSSSIVRSSFSLRRSSSLGDFVSFSTEISFSTGDFDPDFTMVSIGDNFSSFVSNFDGISFSFVSSSFFSSSFSFSSSVSICSSCASNRPSVLTSINFLTIISWMIRIMITFGTIFLIDISSTISIVIHFPFFTYSLIIYSSSSIFNFGVIDSSSFKISTLSTTSSFDRPFLTIISSII